MPIIDVLTSPVPWERVLSTIGRDFSTAGLVGQLQNSEFVQSSTCESAYLAGSFPEVAADVIALGACSDGEMGGDRKSLAPLLSLLHTKHGTSMTLAQTLGFVSGQLIPEHQTPKLSSSRPITDCWSASFF